jgi:general secretion pathway protein G
MSPRIETTTRAGERGFSMVELMIVLVFIGVIASIAIAAAFHAFDASRLGRTVANMRGIADAITRYQSDVSTLPGGGLQPVSSIAPILRPVSGPIPLLDGWDHDLYYEPYTTAGGSLTFRVYSYGKDGSDDGGVTGTWLDFTSDVVVEGGSFIQTKW